MGIDRDGDGADERDGCAYLYLRATDRGNLHRRSRGHQVHRRLHASARRVATADGGRLDLHRGPARRGRFAIPAVRIARGLLWIAALPHDPGVVLPRTDLVDMVV